MGVHLLTCILFSQGLVHMVYETRRADLKCRCQGTEVLPPLAPSCCICQGEKWLAQGSLTHTRLITFIGPTELSQAVVDAGAIPLLVLCIQEPEIALRRIAASALSDVSKHSPELAQTVVDAGAIAHLAQMILNPDAKLKVLFKLCFFPEELQPVFLLWLDIEKAY